MYSREEFETEKARRDQKQAFEQEYKRRNSLSHRAESMFSREKEMEDWRLQTVLALGDYLSNSMSTAGRSVINPARRLMGMENIQPNPIQTGQGPAYEKASQYAPYATAGAIGAVAGPVAASEAMALGAGAGALLNEQDPVGGALLGGGTAGIGEGIGRLGAAGIEKYGKPALKAGQDWLRGNLPAEEITRRMEAAQGTATGLGRILDQPQLTQTLENYLKYIPFSGYQKGVNKTIGELESQAARNLEDISGGVIPKDIDVKQEIQKQLQKSVSGKIEISDANYKKLDKIAKEAGVKVNRDNISEASREILGKINSNPELKRKAGSQLIQDLEFYSYKPKEVSAYREPANVETNPLRREEPSFGQMMAGQQGEIIPGQNVPNQVRPQYPTQANRTVQQALTGAQPKPEYGFGESNITRGLLGEDQFESLFSGKRYESNRYGTLKHALDTDMTQAIDKSNNPEIKGLWNEAQQFYKNEIVPTQAPRIKKFVNDPQLTQSENILATFLKYGPKNDRVKLLNDLTKHLDAPTMEKLRYAVFSDELGEPSLKYMSDTLSKLGPKQKENLIPDPSMRHNMENMTLAAQMNPKALQQMYNPETGAWAKILESVKHLGGLAASYGAGAAPIAAGRYATKALTDEASRNSIIKALLDEGFSEKAAKDVIKKFETPYAKAKGTATALAVTPKERKK